MDLNFLAQITTRHSGNDFPDLPQSLLESFVGLLMLLELTLERSHTFDLILIDGFLLLLCLLQHLSLNGVLFFLPTLDLFCLVVDLLLEGLDELVVAEPRELLRSFARRALSS